MAVRGEKLGSRPTDRPANVLLIGTRALLLRSSRICLTLSDQYERLSCTACHERVRVVYIRFLFQDVHRFKSLPLLDMSNRLSCGHQHVVNLLEWCNNGSRLTLL
jgi:hypothetical protein